MSETRSYTVRPSPKIPRADLKDTFWVYLSPANLLLHGLRPGEACQVVAPNGVSGPVIAFDNAKIQDTIVQISKAVQSLYGLKLGDKISLSYSPGAVAVAQHVTLAEHSEENERQPIPERDHGHWAWIAEDVLRRAEHICQGMVFDNIEAKRQSRSFKVVSINGRRAPPVRIFKLESDVKVRVESDGPKDSQCSFENFVGISKERIAGLDAQIRRINHRLLAYEDPPRRVTFPAGYPTRQGGIILHGPSGTGKTLVLNHLAKTGWRKVLYLQIDFQSRRESDLAVRHVFTEAHQHQPSVIIIDRLESIAGKRNSQEVSMAVNIAQTLGSEMDSLVDAQVLVVAATRTLMDIDEDLRAPGRFDFEVEITIPDSKARCDILKLVSGLPKDADSPELQRIGDRTHGYVGADLLSLFRCAMDKAEDRFLAFGSRDAAKDLIGDPGLEAKVTVEEADLIAARGDVRPTAMREVFLETPQVRWSDIGGQQHVKKSLQKAIEWPFKVQSPSV